MIIRSHFPIHIVHPLTGIWSRSPPESSKEEVQLQCTSDAAAASIYFLYFVYVHLRHPRAPPATGSFPDPLPLPPLGFVPVELDDEPEP